MRPELNRRQPSTAATLLCRALTWMLKPRRHLRTVQGRRGAYAATGIDQSTGRFSMWLRRGGFGPGHGHHLLWEPLESQKGSPRCGYEATRRQC